MAKLERLTLEEEKILRMLERSEVKAIPIGDPIFIPKWDDHIEDYAPKDANAYSRSNPHTSIPRSFAVQFYRILN